MYARDRRSWRRVGAFLAMAIVGTSLILLSKTAPAQAGSCSAGWVALTYDDGPVPTRTNAVLNALDAVDAPGTFFTVGYLVRSYPSTVRDAADRGKCHRRRRARPVPRHLHRYRRTHCPHG